jgi:hypothetical protein
MRNKASRRLIIDADVAQSSGQAAAVDPTSVKCRQFLQSALDICHRVVLTPAILDQWKQHKSRFARAWLSSMWARKKVDRLSPSLDDRLRSAVESVGMSEKHRRVLMNDLHLVEAAIATDGIVVSRDDTARDLFRAASATLGRLRRIVWVNPADEADPSEWLAKGATAEEGRMLGKQVANGEFC